MKIKLTNSQHDRIAEAVTCFIENTCKKQYASEAELKALTNILGLVDTCEPITFDSAAKHEFEIEVPQEKINKLIGLTSECGNNSEKY